MIFSSAAKMIRQTLLDQEVINMDEIFVQTMGRENFYRQIVEQNADAAVIVEDKTSNVVFTNTAAEKLC